MTVDDASFIKQKQVATPPPKKDKSTLQTLTNKHQQKQMICTIQLEIVNKIVLI